MNAGLHGGAQRQGCKQVGAHHGHRGHLLAESVRLDDRDIAGHFWARKGVPGQPIPDVAMHLVIGMGKSSDCRMILEAVSNLELSESEVQDLTPHCKALMRMR